jgi:hypothetical protein
VIAESVSESVESYLKGRELRGNGRVLAATARRLAEQLDAACESKTARGLSAAPPLASRLVEVVGELDRREAALREAEAEEARRAERLEQNRLAGRWATGGG